MANCSRCGTEMTEICAKCGFKLEIFSIKEYILHEPDVAKLKEILMTVGERLQHLAAIT